MKKGLVDFVEFIEFIEFIVSIDFSLDLSSFLVSDSFLSKFVKRFFIRIIKRFSIIRNSVWRII